MGNKQFNNYLYKTSKEFKTDIDGFGKHVVKEFLFTDNWHEYNWLKNYSNAFFDVNVEVDVQSGRLLMET